MIRRNTVSLIFISSIMMLMPMETLLIIMATDIYVISIIMLPEFSLIAAAGVGAGISCDLSSLLLQLLEWGHGYPVT